MTGSLAALAVATAWFVGSHLLLSHPRIREALVARLGEPLFRGVYSVLALALLAWMAVAYGDAPIVIAFVPPLGLQHLSLLMMPFACIFFVAGLTTTNPLAIGGSMPETGRLVSSRSPVTR